jgi:hypothetical protein
MSRKKRKNIIHFVYSSHMEPARTEKIPESRDILTYCSVNKVQITCPLVCPLFPNAPLARQVQEPLVEIIRNHHQHDNPYEPRGLLHPGKQKLSKESYSEPATCLATATAILRRAST